MGKVILKGMKKVTMNLNKEIRAIEGRSEVGLIKAAIFIRNDMEKTAPTIPVDTNNLRDSWFATPYSQMGAKKGASNLIGVFIGFTANYALWVHEMVDAKIKWKRPGSGPKFLESALNRNHGKILDIIRQEAKIK